MKKIFTLAFGIALSVNTFAQFFDSVPYRGAFGIKNGTREIGTGYAGYNPDPSNTDADWTKPWAEFAPNTVAYPGDPGYNSSNPQFYTKGTAAEKVTISADIASDYTMTKDKWYELSGLIHVLNGATLTIEPGTCIRGSLSNLGGLIITQGAKIMAISDRFHPIVMTSQKPVGSRVRGDWAGLLILGKSINNNPGGQRIFEALPADPLALYGGGVNPNEADNSGSIRYMRVEFAGYNYLPDQEINGVTFGAVGSGSHFDYMQSSFANDDAYEWFGGTCSHKYLISYAETDDQFDMDEGYHGNLQYLLGVRSAGLTETSPAGACNGLEHDNNTNLGTSSAVNPNITAPLPTTAPTISNMTLVGPQHPGANKSALNTLWQQRMGEQYRIRTNAATGVFNSIAWGYATEINLPNVGNLAPSVQTRASNDELCIRNNSIISNEFQSGSTNVKFVSSNYPTGANVWPLGATPWTGLGNMRNWMMNGPDVSVYNYTGPTGNDTSILVVSTADISHPDYNGTSNGALSQLDYTVCDFTLTGTSSKFYGNSSFQHPRVALVVRPSISANPTFFPSFTQNLGTPSASKMIVVKSTALTSGVLVTAPSGFEVSANGTSAWATSFTKGSTAADTLVFVRLNRSTAGNSNGFLVLSSTKTPNEFNPLNIAINGTCVAPASPYVNVNVSSLSFSLNSIKSFVVSGRNLTSNLTITAPANFQVSDNATTGFNATLLVNQNAGKLANTNVYVKYIGAGSIDNASLTISAAGVDPISIALNGNSTPMIDVAPGLVTAAGGSQIQYPYINTIAGTPSLSYPIYINASQLTDTVKVGLIQSNSSALSNFQLSLDSMFTNPVTSLNLNTNRASSLNTTIYVRYNAALATTNAGFVTFTSAGAPLIYQANSTVITGPANQIVSLSARASAVGGKKVSIYAPSYQLRYSSVLGMATAPQSIWVSGDNLGSDSAVVVTAPANWEVSLSNANGSYTQSLILPNIGGSVASTQVYVRYNPSVPFALNQNIIVTASSATPTPNTNNATNVVEYVYGVATPTVNTDLTSLPTFYTTVGKPSVANSFMVSGSKLTQAVVVKGSNVFQVSLDSLSFKDSVLVNQTAGDATLTKVYVRYLSNTPGQVSGSYVSVVTFGGSSIPVNVTALAVLPALPVLSISTASLPAFAINSTTASAPQSFTFSALNLLAPMDINVGPDFELSNDSTTYKNTWSITPDVDGNIATTKLFCRYKRSSAGNSSDTIKFMSMGVQPQGVLVSGKSTSGIKEISNIATMKLYPNPAKNNVFVEFELTENSQVSVSVLDLSGKEVGTKVINNFSKGSNSIELPLDELLNGFYFVSMVSDKGVVTSKLSVIK